MSSTSTSHNFVTVPVSSILISVGAHFALLVFLLSLNALQGLSVFHKKDLKEPYQSFIQVDVVALPDQLPNQMTNIDMSQSVVEKPASPEMKTEVPSTPADIMKMADKNADKKEIEKRSKKQMAEEQSKALKRLQEEAKREQALKELSAKARQTGRARLAGNRLSQGNSAVGMIGTASDQYRALVSDAIRRHFNIYLWQQKKGALITDIYLEVYPNGRVKARKVIKPSSDPLFDSAVLQAIDASQPLPVPEDISLLKEGFQITFKP
ncbi:MAG: cell envelope integrity protein TolA [Deltaproteobacteria bacterium]|nr:cell envelope integrity protein TolA [Deltaproteobacteria bacterium]